MTIKRDFYDLNFFEKLFLVLFSRNNDFEKSIGNIYSNEKIFDYRKKKYPLIFFFHLYSEKTTYKFDDIYLLKKLFYFFNKSKINFYLQKRLKNIFTDIFGNKLSKYIVFLITQKILYKRYYNLCSSIFFKKYKKNNLIKLSWAFYVFLLNSKKNKIVYDLSKYTDWYSFNFNRFKKHILIKKNIIKYKYTNNNNKLNYLKFRNKNMFFLKILYYKYNLFFKKIYVNTSEIYHNIFYLNFKFLNLKKKKIFINKVWNEKLSFFYPIRFNEVSINKNIEDKNLNNYLIFYIRKNRIFNKGRYSRNRQLYRTGVYWCLWLNIILVYGLYFLFYRFTFNFGYFWWGLLILFYSTIFSKVLKYNYFNLYKIYSEFIFFTKWLGFIIRSLRFDLTGIIFYYKFFFVKHGLYFQLIVNLHFWYKKINKTEIVYFWESLSYKDYSFLRYKTFLHWLNQLYKFITF